MLKERKLERKVDSLKQSKSVIICIDLKSFYASVECVERGLDPFKTNEICHFREWDEKREQDLNLLDFPAHQDFHRFMADLNRFYLKHPAFFEKDYDTDGFRWLDCHSEERCVYAFERAGKKKSWLSLISPARNRADISSRSPEP